MWFRIFIIPLFRGFVKKKISFGRSFRAKDLQFRRLFDIINYRKRKSDEEGDRNMKNELVLARCNLFGVFGAIPKLLELDTEAASIVRKKTISLGFVIKNGPSATLSFANSKSLRSP